jgi:hypothetical protein
MNGKSIGVVLAVINIVLVVFVLIFAIKPGANSGISVDAVDANRVAAALANRGLYDEAETRLRRVADSSNASDEQKANALFQIGTWQLERARNAGKALAAFIELRERFGNSELGKEAAKKEVACLDVLGRPLDAKGVLDETAKVDSQKAASPREGAILAKIGAREITSGDLDAEIRRMPPEVQSQFTDKNAKRQMLQSLVARELLFDSAKEQGLENDPEVQRSTAEAKKGIMVMQLIEKQTADKVHVDPVDVKNYYEANKDKIKDKDGNIPPFEKVSDQLAQRLAQEKKMALVQKMIEELGTSRQVQMFPDKL